jgi:hypothetical protein
MPLKIAPGAPTAPRAEVAGPGFEFRLEPGLSDADGSARASGKGNPTANTPNFWWVTSSTTGVKTISQIRTVSDSDCSGK